MCIIFYKEKGKIPSEWIDNALRLNKDGFGVMYPHKGRIYLLKSVKFEDAHHIADIANGQNKAAVHFRIKTAGKINKDNAHPFCVTSVAAGDPLDVYMMHNGCLDVDSTPTESDSKIFAEKILRPMLRKFPNLLQDKSFQKILEGFAGTSKLLFMDGMGRTTIINEGLGTWEKNGGFPIWCSSDYYKERKVTKWQSDGNSYYYKGGWHGKDDFYDNNIATEPAITTPETGTHPLDWTIAQFKEKYKNLNCSFTVAVSVSGLRATTGYGITFEYWNAENAKRYPALFLRRIDNLASLWESGYSGHISTSIKGTGEVTLIPYRALPKFIYALEKIEKYRLTVQGREISEIIRCRDEEDIIIRAMDLDDNIIEQAISKEVAEVVKK